MKRYADLTDIYVMRSMIERRVKNSTGMGVEFVDDPEQLMTASTTDRSIRIPLPKPPITEDGLDLIYGYMVHETGHHTRPEVFTIAKKAGLVTGSPLGNLYNAIEDQVMERSIQEQYVGDRSALSKGSELNIQKQLDALTRYPERLDSSNEDQVKIAAVYCLQMESRSDWDTRSPLALEKLKKLLPQDSLNLFEELCDEGWIDKIRTCGDEAESFKLTLDLYKRLYPEINQEDLDKLYDQATGSGGEPSSDSEGEQSTLSEKINKDAGHPVKGKDKLIFSWEDLVSSDHHTGESSPAIVDWEGHSGGAVNFYSPSQIHVERPVSEHPRSRYITDDKESRALANNIRVYIQAQARKRIVSERKHGRLYKRDLVRLAMPPIDKGEWNRKIFYQLDHKEYMDTAVGILVDASGSMSGDPFIMASAACQRLVHTFDNILRIPCFVASFTTRYSSPYGPHIGVVKEFNEVVRNNTTIPYRFAQLAKEMAGNADGDSLLWMFGEMYKRKESRKIMIVLTDGAPTDAVDGADPDATLKRAAWSIERVPGYTLAAVGIEHTGVKRYYKNYRVINNITELNPCLLDLMREVYTNEQR